MVPSDTRDCPFCGESVEAAAARCPHCHSVLSAPDEQDSAGPPGDKEVLGREPKGSRGALMAVAGVLVVVLVAYGATLVVSSLRPEHQAEPFNLFTTIRNACDQDDGNLVTTDRHGTPMAFPTPDGPQRYWCVSRHYLTSIGRAPGDSPPSVRKVPHEYRWLWPRTTYGR